MPKLQGLDLSFACLRNANLQGANLSGTNLEGANLSSAPSFHDLSRINTKSCWEPDPSRDRPHDSPEPTNLSNANLSAVNFHSANLEGINFENANLDLTNLKNTNLTSANLAGVNAQGVYFDNSNLAGVNFENAKLFDISFSNTILWGTNFKDTSIEVASFYETLIINATFDNSSFNETIFSSGNIFLSTNLQKAHKLWSSILHLESNAVLVCNSLLMPKKISPKEISLKDTTLTEKILSLVDSDPNSHPNKDCGKLPMILRKRYPDWFETIDDAESFVKRFQAEIP